MEGLDALDNKGDLILARMQKQGHKKPLSSLYILIRVRSGRFFSTKEAGSIPER